MPFTDILTANSEYSGHHKDLPSGIAQRGLAIVTCIDTRIDPLEQFGLVLGDAKMVRNAGARVTDDVLRTLVIACHALGVERIALIQHTDCGATRSTQAEVVEMVESVTGENAEDCDFLMIEDQRATLRADAAKIRECKLLPPGVEVGTFIYDVHGGTLSAIE